MSPALLSSDLDIRRLIDSSSLLFRHGVVVAGRIPLVIEGNEHSDRYIAVKRSRMGHLT